MQYCVKLSEPVQKMLSCPICKAKLELYDKYYQCKNLQCNFLFPIINGIPILIDNNSSVFCIDDFVITVTLHFFRLKRNLRKQ